MYNFSGKKKVKYSELDTSLRKLRRKYGNLKQNWRKITDKAKFGSGHATEQEYEWYKFLNPVFAEANAEIELSSGKDDLSFRGDYAPLSSSDDDSRNSDHSSDDSDNDDSTDDEGLDETPDNEDGENAIRDDTNTPEQDIETENIVDIVGEDDSQANTAPVRRGKRRLKGTGKTVIVSHKKKGRIRSQVEAHSSMADSIRKFAESQDKRWK